MYLWPYNPIFIISSLQTFLQKVIFFADMYYNYSYVPAAFALSHSLQNKRAQDMKMRFLRNIIFFQSPSIRCRETTDEILISNDT